MKTLYKTILLIIFTLVSAGLAVAQAGGGDREKGVALYNQGDYENAVKTLKNATKTSAADVQAWYYLGLAYLKKDKPKEAEKALAKAVELDNKNAAVHTSLGYVYLLRNNSNGAQTEAKTALALNPNIPDAHYIMGFVSAQNGSYVAAYERARRVIELAPDFALAYRLKSQMLVGSFAAQTGTVTKPKSARSDLLKEAVTDLEKYLSLSPTGTDAQFQRQYLESLKFFAEYYSRPENQAPNFGTTAQEEEESAGKTPLKILYKQRAGYSGAAREAGVAGKIRVLVGFGANGRIEHILVIKPLGYGLDEEAVKAARAIRFEPATQDGKPVAVVKVVEYTFSIY
ncbi:MAG TPA: TonB family protein [Pyrinomonadaceae bacterium]|jgi:TonB family protein